MHQAFLYLDIPNKFSSPADYLKLNSERHMNSLLISERPDVQTSIVQRAEFNETYIQDTITYYFVRDGYGATLRWWQEPVSSFEILTKINPDLITIVGLNLPLNFRWLRRMVGEDSKIIGSHTGEEIWAQRNLWLQQFGLRVADGFIFQNKPDTEAWLRAAVILPRQPIYILNSFGLAEQTEAEKLKDIYQELLQ